MISQQTFVNSSSLRQRIHTSIIRSYSIIFPLARVVPPHDALNGPQQPLEPVFTEGRDLDLGRANNTRGARSVIEQSQLTKIITLLVLVNGPTSIRALKHLSLARLQDKKRLARIALLDDGRSGRKLVRLQGIRDLAPLIRRQARQQRHLLQEALVHSPPSKRAIHQDAAEGDAIEGPQRARFLADHGCGARGVVHERELAKAAAGAALADFGAGSVGAGFEPAGGVHVDGEAASLDDVEVVALVALGDDFDALGGDGLFLQRTEHLGGLLIVEVGEEEVVGDGGAEPGLLLCRLGVVGRAEVVVGG